MKTTVGSQPSPTSADDRNDHTFHFNMSKQRLAILVMSGFKKISYEIQLLLLVDHLWNILPEINFRICGNTATYHPKIPIRWRS
jgi:hypothetical protein